MRLHLTLLTVCLGLITSGCASLLTSDLADIPDFARAKFADSKDRSNSNDGPNFEAFENRYRDIKAVATPRSKDVPLSDSPSVLSALKTHVVQTLVDEMYNSSTTKGKVGPHRVTLSASDVSEFHKAIKAMNSGLISEAGTKANAKKLDLMLVAYFKAYAAGNFVDRFGTQSTQPSLNGGIDDAAITGLVSVFWEALLDYWTDVPVFGVTKAATSSNSYAPHYKVDPINSTQYSVDYYTLTVNTTPASALYVTGDKNLEPTALLCGYAQYKECDATMPKEKWEAANRVSKLCGQGANAGASLVFGSLGKINIGFIVMPGISVGDNKTLLQIVETTADVLTRRGVQLGIYAALSNNTSAKDGPDVDRILATYGR